MLRFTAASLTAVFLSSAAQATTDFSFTGNFRGDADVAEFTFMITEVSDVTLVSYSYGGGIMADGTVIDAGGFDPILALWDENGDLIDEFDDGPMPVNTDPVTFGDYDTNLLLTSLAPGKYTATIAQYENFAAGTNLSEGFSESDAFFTASFGCSQGQFCDTDGFDRTSFWAFDILGVDAVTTPTTPSAIPLPAGMPLLFGALGGLALLKRRKG